MLPSNVTYYGSAVLYECKPRYKLDGHDRRLCLENGTWNSDPPKCLGKTIKIIFYAFISQRGNLILSSVVKLQFYFPKNCCQYNLLF